MAERLASNLHHYAKKKGGLRKAASLLEERDSSSMSTVKDSNQGWLNGLFMLDSHNYQ